jgi:hypothetical protein
MEKIETDLIRLSRSKWVLLDRKLPPSIPLGSISRDVGYVAIDSGLDPAVNCWSGYKQIITCKWRKRTRN